MLMKTMIIIIIKGIGEKKISALGRRSPKNCSPDSGQTSCLDSSTEVNETKDSVGCRRLNVGRTLMPVRL